MSGLRPRARAERFSPQARSKKRLNEMTLTELITQRLQDRLHPTRLEVTDESHQHHGHAGWREGGETHFRLDIVSDAFDGKSRIERHRLVNEILAEAFERGLHALAIKARTPGE
jgi:BolA family transcriptional regulator, general stress-responsive regulator